jgi:uncharacterized protein DUF2585
MVRQQSKATLVKTPLWVAFPVIAVLMSFTALAELWMGRKPWGVGGVPGLWSGSIWSEHNSQFLTDPYTFTHILHGILIYAIVTLAFRKWPLSWRLMLAVGIEGAWEILENSDFIINRYRAETISLNYYGDSIVNSMGDIMACMFGFALASRLPTRAVIALTISLELLLLVWTRDNLTLNIVMLLHPNPVIRAWQLGK